MYLSRERINALERVLNVREGLRAEGDAIPPRLIDGGVPKGPRRAQTVDFGPHALQSSTQRAGCDPVTSLPTSETLARLGLEWVLEDPVVAGLVDRE